MTNVNQVDDLPPRLTLFQLVDRAHTWFGHALRRSLEQRGGPALTLADLHLLANLDCGTTYASELARRLGVSRQAVNKLVHNLTSAGLLRLETVARQRNRKAIVITEEGTEWIRWLLTELDQMEAGLSQRLGATTAKQLRKALEADWG